MEPLSRPLDHSAVARSVPAAVLTPAGTAPDVPLRGTLALRARVVAAGWRGRMRWALHADDRAWIASRFALPLEDTPHAQRIHHVGVRHYALGERCLVVETREDARDAVGLVLAGGPLPERAIYAFVHSPAMWLCLYGLVNQGIRFSPVVADWYWDDPLRAVRDAVLATRGGAAIAVESGFGTIMQALTEGSSLGVAVDVPGSTRVRFLHKEASVRSGLVRLAQAAGVPIVPMWGDFRHGRPLVVVSAPIVPSEDTEAVLREVLASLEAPLLLRPEQWMPYTGDLWPDRCEAHRAAYAEEPSEDEVASTS